MYRQLSTQPVILDAFILSMDFTASILKGFLGNHFFHNNYYKIWLLPLIMYVRWRVVYEVWRVDTLSVKLPSCESKCHFLMDCFALGIALVCLLILVLSLGGDVPIICQLFYFWYGIKEILPPSHSFLVIAGVLESTGGVMGAVFSRTFEMQDPILFWII